jgi:hypothetical protein
LNFAGDEQGANALASSLHSKVEPASLAANLNVALDFVVLAAGALLISTVGATVSGVAGGFGFEGGLGSEGGFGESGGVSGCGVSPNS